MSFRKAADHTLIAQLVGRMVRTPLARRIEDNDFLGSVALFLPHYDEEGLEAIVKKLEDPDISRCDRFQNFKFFAGKAFDRKQHGQNPGGR